MTVTAWSTEPASAARSWRAIALATLLLVPAVWAVLAGLVAEVLGIDPFDIRCVTGDTDLTPVDLGSYSSRVTLMMGNAAIQAAERARELVADAVSRKLDLPRERIAFAGGRVFDVESPERGIFAGYFFPGQRDRGLMVTADLATVAPWLDGTTVYAGVFNGNRFFDDNNDELNYNFRIRKVFDSLPLAIGVSAQRGTQLLSPGLAGSGDENVYGVDVQYVLGRRVKKARNLPEMERAFGPGARVLYLYSPNAPIDRELLDLLREGRIVAADGRGPLVEVTLPVPDASAP